MKLKSYVAGVVFVGASLACSADPPAGAPDARLLDGREAELDAERQRLRDLQKIRVTFVDPQGNIVADEEVDIDATELIQLFVNVCGLEMEQPSGCVYAPDPCATGKQNLCRAWLKTCSANYLLEIAALRGAPLTLPLIDGSKFVIGAQSRASQASVADAASTAAAEAHVLFEQLLFEAVQPLSCVQNMLGQTFIGKTIGERIGGGYVENFYTYKEATDRFVENTLAVADWHQSTSPSELVAGGRSYAGAALSRAAAAHKLVGGDEGFVRLDSTGRALEVAGQPSAAVTDQPLCTAPEPAKGVQAAIDVFRKAAVAPQDILNPNLALDALLNSVGDCPNGSCYTSTGQPKPENGQPPNYSVRERLADLWNQEAELLASGSPSIEDHLGLAPADFQEAREFLAQEILAFGRTQDDDFHLAPRPVIGTRKTVAPVWPATANAAPQRPGGYFSTLGRYTANPVAFQPTPGNYAEFVDRALTSASAALAQKENVSPQARPILLDAIALLESDAKRERFGRWQMIRTGTSTWDFGVLGASATDMLRIVRGEEGLSCAVNATVEGAECDLGDLTVAELALDFTPLPGSGFSKGVASGSITATLQPGTRIYLVGRVASDSGNKYELLVGAWVHDDEIYFEEIPVVPDAERRAGEILEPSRDWCARSIETCAHFAFDGRIPLEDELSDDGNDVESSWKHYLGLARAAAMEADALGNEVISSGERGIEVQLQQAQRAEIALEELQDICGVDVDAQTLHNLLSGENGASSIAALNTTVACQSDSQCVSGTGLDPNVGYKCGASGFCVGDPVATALKKAAGNPQLQRLTECLSSGNVKTFVSPGSAPLCVWLKNGDVNQLCADASPNMPCPAFREGPACNPSNVPNAEYDQYPINEDQLLGYFENVGPGTTPPSASLCDSVRRLRAPGGDDNDRALHAYAIAASGFFHPDVLGPIVHNITWEPQFGAYSAVKFNGETVYKTGDPWLGVSENWPCTPSGVLCDEAHQGLFCAWSICSSLADTEQVAGRARMNDWLMRAVLALRRTFPTRSPAEFNGDTFAKPGVKLPYKYVPNGARGNLWELAKVFWDKRTDSTRARPRNDPLTDLAPVRVVTFALDNDTRQYVSASVNSTVPDDKLAWAWYEGSTLQRFEPNQLTGESLVIADFYWPNCTTEVQAQGRSCFTPFYGGLSTAGGVPIQGYYLAKLLEPGAVSIHPAFRAQDAPAIPATNLDPTRYVSAQNYHDGFYNGLNKLCAYECRNEGPFEFIQCLFDCDALTNQFQPLGLTPLDDSALLDGLELACEIGRRNQGGCDLNNLPQINEDTGLSSVRTYLNCAAENIQRSAGLTVYANFPARAVDALRKESKLGSYPAVGGQYGQAVAELRAALVEVSEVTPLISAELRGLSGDIEAMETSTALAGVRKKMADVQFMSTVANQLAACASAAGGLNFATPAVCANSVAQIQFGKQLASLQGKEADLAQDQAMIEFRQRFSTRATTLQTLGARITKSADLINAQLAGLETLRAKAERALAKVVWDDSDVGKHQTELLSVAKARHNTNVVRYEAARRNAIQMAFLAKRSIETRLAVRLSKMNQDLPLVPAPSTWEADVCTLSGVNFDEIARGNVKDYADAYIGDYVTKLENVVESYRLAHNFHEGTDTAVISLRDDWLGVRAECETPVDNLLTNASAFGNAQFAPATTDFSAVNGKWLMAGCNEQTINDVVGPLPNCIGAFALPDAEGPFDASVPALGAAGGYRVGRGPMDGSACEPNTCGFTGFTPIVQTVLLAPGRYRLSYYGRDVEGFAGLANSSGYLVDLDLEDVVVPIVTNSEPGANGWTRNWGTYELSEETHALVWMMPPTGSPSQIDIAAPMLEAEVSNDVGAPCENAGDCRGGLCISSGGNNVCDERPKPFADTSETRTRVVATCQDTTGEVFRRTKWARGCVKLCPDGFSDSCDSRAAKTKCYRETSVTFNQRDIDAGRVFGVSGFAQGNFNYRIDSLGLNVVGTGVRDCSKSKNPSACFASGYATYSIVHGGPYKVRNHEGADEPVPLFTGRIEHARALAAERYVTNPLSSSDRELIGGYLRREFRGRPLDGTFSIRIWEDEEIDFDAIEDVQLLLDYRYWTRFN